MRDWVRLCRTIAGLTTAGATLLSPVLDGISSALAREIVAVNSTVPPGTILVRTDERRLYLILGDGQALRYKVGVGRLGRQWAGTSLIEGKFVEPNWRPPPDIRRDRPDLPDVVPGGSAANPMGAAAMTLTGGQYAIHGTNAPESIGGFVSYGCIRMYNDEILDLFDRVTVGTRVIVVH